MPLPRGPEGHAALMRLGAAVLASTVTDRWGPLVSAQNKPEKEQRALGIRTRHLASARAVASHWAALCLCYYTGRI